MARRAGERAQGVAETSGQVAALLDSVRGNASTAREASALISVGARGWNAGA
jgi:hypothetical protein